MPKTPWDIFSGGLIFFFAHVMQLADISDLKSVKLRVRLPSWALYSAVWPSGKAVDFDSMIVGSNPATAIPIFFSPYNEEVNHMIRNRKQILMDLYRRRASRARRSGETVERVRYFNNRWNEVRIRPRRRG